MLVRGVMEGFDEIEMERAYDSDETIFVAVGKNVTKSKTTLFWAVRSFSGKRICLLHVHQPDTFVALTDAKPGFNESRHDTNEAFQELGRRKLHYVLDQYCDMLAHEGVEADGVWIEMDNIEKGIVEIIAQNNIRWLVMGAAADKYYSKMLTELKSKKATYVCQNAHPACHIWFVCKECLIYTRGGSNDGSESEIALPLVPVNLDLETEQSELLRSESAAQICRYIGVDENADDPEELLGSFNYQCTLQSDQFLNPLKLMPLLTNEREMSQLRLEQAIKDAKDLGKIAFQETVRRWKEEDVAMEAKCKARLILYLTSSIPSFMHYSSNSKTKAFEGLCVKEMKMRKEAEEAIAKNKEEMERIKNQRDDFLQEIQMVQGQKSLLERQIAESHSTVKELEEKIISAVDLLIRFKERRDKARIECETVTREVTRLRNLADIEALKLGRSEILDFSFMEINEATHNFDPSRKIGEGRYGSTYEGLLHHVHVVMKMLPAYGSQSELDFKNGVEILSRVRHPNLLSLIGICSESRSLVYEYVKNGSLEDCLLNKGKTLPIPWQTRVRICIEICSALIFLHSNKPCIIHGNLKPSKILLDANFVSKLSDFGMFLLIKQGEGRVKSEMKNSYPCSGSVYLAPEYLETGTLTSESDVYSFGIILLQLLTGRPASDVVRDVKWALETETLKSMIDTSAGDWPFEQVKELAKLGLRCCEKNQSNRPDLETEIWSVLQPLKASTTGPASLKESKELRRTPTHFICPIFQEVMEDPQIAADGYTYDADAIRGWLKSGHNTSPMTNLKLEHINLIPNHPLHQAIQEWKQLTDT
ncbi:hypothetical protein K2173_008603 [Erythroxylum novogranatense]|uniref:RING-type E3 ubiquitin transferase n=1 Tax=Erythroxylum novogranatense TaxID=1862640 RepID=A0AAV8SLP0_9ROSI|nr:hypothetical protein K2173_008603 [Erythroxylum novogranatense]